ncbi:MAG: sigma-70 family RNA polymerase sigma factor [Planctomycetota bacterium]
MSGFASDARIPSRAGVGLKAEHYAEIEAGGFETDGAAWFELWETFGPILRAQLSRWGRGRIGVETVQDLSQDTMVALAGAIDRHDPSRGARFSTWLLAIAKYTLSDEMDRRGALKRGSGVKPVALDGVEGLDPGSDQLQPDEQYELEVFDAKVEAALRRLERDADLLDFETFRLRVLEGQSGREVAEALGTSEPTVSRRLARARTTLQGILFDVFARFSFADEEWQEMERNGLGRIPNKTEDASFDDSVLEIYSRIAARRRGASQTAPPA